MSQDKIYGVFSTSDPYEPRQLEGLFKNLEDAEKRAEQTIKEEEGGTLKPHHNENGYVVGYGEYDKKFGYSVFIEEIEVQ